MSRLVACIVAVALVTLTATAVGQQRPSYPWEMPAEQVEAFSSLTYEAGMVRAIFGEGHCAPIVIQVPGQDGRPQPQVTGLEVLAKGTVEVKHGDQVLFEDDIHGAMLRFHPEDQAAFVTTESKQADPSPGLRRLLLDMCVGSFQRFWHRRMEAFVPDRGAVAAFVYSNEEGGVMIWQSDKELGAFGTDTKTELFKIGL